MHEEDDGCGGEVIPVPGRADLFCCFGSACV